jgi:glycosyltransferase 2 family protein
MRLSSRKLSVVGILLFILILSRIDVPGTLGMIARVNPAYIFLCWVTVACEVLLRSLRWRLLVKQFAKGYTVKDGVQTMLMGVAFGAVTPGRVGDIIKAFDVRDRGIETKKALSIEILDRLLDLFYLLISAAAGYLFLAAAVSGFGIDGRMLAAIALLIAVFAVVLFSTSSLGWALRPLHNFLVPDRFKNRSKELFKTFQETSAHIRQPLLATELLALTAAWWTVLFLRPYFLCQGLGVDLSPLAFVLAMPVVSLIEVIPVSVLGIGTRDLGFIAVFSVLGVPAETMMAVSLITLILFVLPQVALGFYIAYKKGISLDLSSKDA